MTEEVKKEELVEEGEIVEIESEETEKNEVDSDPVEEVQAEESKEKEDDPELEDYSERVKKRISNLTRRLREAERASESAYTYANQVQAENKQLQEKSVNSDKSYLSEAETRLKSQKVQAQAALKAAYEEQDFDKVGKAQDIIAKIAVEESKIDASKSQLEYQNVLKEQQNQQVLQQNFQPQNQESPPLDPKLENWMEKNVWFGTDEDMTLSAMNTHRKLVEEEGFDPRTDEYYTEIDKRIRTVFPQNFNDVEDGGKKPAQRVASAGRADTSAAPTKKQVRLSPSEVQMAKKLNVPLNEYAKFVKR
tara:strand:- start:3915 stop:4832 length:918 start_codon:yes stop_codon:yes gene_type:complete